MVSADALHGMKNETYGGGWEDGRRSEKARAKEDGSA
jgi:hypothetical protein